MHNTCTDNVVAGTEFQQSLSLMSNKNPVNTIKELSSITLGVQAYDQVTSTMDIAQSIIRKKYIENIATPILIKLPIVDLPVITDPNRAPSHCSNLAIPNFVEVILARSQTAGRGRQGRIWQSSFDSGLYLSVMLPEPLVKTGGFSLAVGVAVAHTCQHFGILAGLKWPNDVMVNRSMKIVKDANTKEYNINSLAKISGVLIEKPSLGHLMMGSLIIGVGLNLRRSEELSKLNGISFEDCIDTVDYFEVLSVLLVNIMSAINKFYQYGFPYFMHEFNSLSVLTGHTVSCVVHNGLVGNRSTNNELIGESSIKDRQVFRNTKKICGIATGIDQQGGLLIDTKDVKNVSICSGEVSIDYK